ncbi:MAG: hypothetical protein DIZ80_03640 [endosymbiont of Galathealinum brachiosum]|uniref:PBP domain-containing protein n=1 Tax=endosymbiont of Galathealinum brachiosum TaxID=2200906 RepID=A0A370DJ33_9GAMM|nr:MAG: hypothetical protein DIZ80_03640 [endosymbiont of Galathealinum brachiosum]
MHHHSIPRHQYRKFYISSIFFLFSSMLSNSYANETHPVMGAGPSTTVAELFFKHFSLKPVAQNYSFIVESRSIKHAGGIKASGEYLFGRTGRPLNKKEKELNKHEIIIARIPLSFVTGKNTGVNHITLKQLKSIYSRKTTNWGQLGGNNSEIILAGREPTEAAYSALKHDHPFLNQVAFDQILTRDHQLVNFIKSTSGDYAIGFGAQSNFDTSYLLKVDDFNSGLSLGLVYDTKNMNHPVVKAAIDFSRSDTWRELVTAHDFLPPEIHK